MAQSQANETIVEALIHEHIALTVCTCAEESTIRGFLEELSFEFKEKVREVRFLQLPENEIDSFSLKEHDVDVAIVCHSIQNREFAITDVQYSLYTKFLRKAAKELGKKNLGLIVHDFPRDFLMDDEEVNTRMTSFRKKQPTTFKTTSMVMLGGKLEESPAELDPKNWADIKTFVAKALKAADEAATAASKPPLSTTILHHRLFVPAVIVAVVVIVVLALAIGLGVGLSGSGDVSPTEPTTNFSTLYSTSMLTSRIPSENTTTTLMN